MDIRISVLLLIFAVIGSFAVSPDGSQSPKDVSEHTSTTTSKSTSESLELTTKSTTTSFSTTDASPSEGGKSKEANKITSTVTPTTTFVTNTPRLSSTSEIKTTASTETPTTVIVNNPQSKNENDTSMKVKNNEEKLKNEIKPPSSSNGNSDSASNKNPSSSIDLNPVVPGYPLNYNFIDNSFWRYQQSGFNNPYYPRNSWYPYQTPYYKPPSFQSTYPYDPRVGNLRPPPYDYYYQHYNPGYTPYKIPSPNFDMDDRSTYNPKLSYNRNHYPFNGPPNYPYHNYNNQFANYYPARNLNWENNVAPAITGPASYVAPASAFDSVSDEESLGASFYNNESANQNIPFLQPVEFGPKKNVQEQTYEEDARWRMQPVIPNVNAGFSSDSQLNRVNHFSPEVSSQPAQYIPPQSRWQLPPFSGTNDDSSSDCYDKTIPSELETIRMGDSGKNYYHSTLY